MAAPYSRPQATLLRRRLAKPRSGRACIDHEGGTIVVTPMRPTLSKAAAAAAAKELIRRNSALFKRLA